MNKACKFTPDEDAPLLLSWHRGDFSAFEALVWKYLQRTYSLAFYLTGNPESAAAAARSAFIAAFTNIHTYNSRLHFSSWLAALTLKETRELLEYREPLTRTEDTTDDFGERLRQQILRVPPEMAEIIVLRYVRGYSLERIAEIYQLRADSLISRLFTALESLATPVPGPLAAEGAMGSEEQPPFHQEIRRSFHAYLDSSLTTAEAEELRKHLKSCSGCRDALSGLEWIVEHLRKLPDVAPPPTLAVTIIQQVRVEPPRRERTPENPPSILKLQIGTGLLLLAAVAISAYLLLHEREIIAPPAVRKIPVPTATAPEQESTTPGAGVITSIGIPATPAGKPISPTTGPAVRPAPVPLPAPLPKAAPLPAATAPLATSPATGRSGADAGQRQRERGPELPAEWGGSPPPQRPQPAKAAGGRDRSGELGVELATTDPLAAIDKVERAVTDLDGKITGRAYSSGSDILYITIDVDRFFELISRLGKTGRILALPQLPEGSEGPVDLAIKWR